jgi:hypothetical protein
MNFSEITSVDEIGLSGGEFAVEVGRGNAAVHEEVAAGDERAVGAYEERANCSDLVRGPAAAGGAEFDHAPVSLTAEPGQLVPGSGVKMMPGLIVLRSSPSPATQQQPEPIGSAPHNQTTKARRDYRPVTYIRVPHPPFVPGNFVGSAR